MVVFTCNHCGDSLQKPKVAKHYQFHCRKHPDLTCVDCHKDFRGDEYNVHTTCITENERYGGQDYVMKANSNKGERKQNKWIDIVQNVLNDDQTLSPPERNFLNQISHHQNIPRKKAKFMNFIKSSMGNRANWTIAENVWDKMEKAFKESKENEKEENAKENGNTENSMVENENNENMVKESEDKENPNGEVSEKKKKSKKRKLEPESNFSETVNTKSHTNDQSAMREGEVTVEKKRKSKKSKLDLENASLEIVNTKHNMENGSVTQESEDTEKKEKSKKRKQKSEADTLENVNNKVPAGNENNESMVDESEIAKVKKKKSKKSKLESENMTENEKIIEAEQSEIPTEKKKKKKKGSENTEADPKDSEAIQELMQLQVNHEEGTSDKFDWKTTIREVLSKKGALTIKKLQKKVVGRYIHSHSERTEEKGLVKFEKTLKKMTNIIIENEIVKMNQS